MSSLSSEKEASRTASLENASLRKEILCGNKNTCAFFLPPPVCHPFSYLTVRSRGIKQKLQRTQLKSRSSRSTDSAGGAELADARPSSGRHRSSSSSVSSTAIIIEKVDNAVSADRTSGTAGDDKRNDHEDSDPLPLRRSSSAAVVSTSSASRQPLPSPSKIVPPTMYPSQDHTLRRSSIASGGDARVLDLKQQRMRRSLSSVASVTLATRTARAPSSGRHSLPASRPQRQPSTVSVLPTTTVEIRKSTSKYLTRRRNSLIPLPSGLPEQYQQSISAPSV